MEKLRVDALAEWGEEAGADPEDIRPGVQPVDEDMILDYLLNSQKAPILPEYSARPFAEWLNQDWYQYSERTTQTNGEVIEGALWDWRGGCAPDA